MGCCLYFCLFGDFKPNTAALTLAPFSKNTGSASALMGAIQLGLRCIASLLRVFVKDSKVPMVVIMMVWTIAALVVLILEDTQDYCKILSCYII
jgi:DHA1 family bicyclomycin/chloramphenicol resistance-like MFS transporter